MDRGRSQGSKLVELPDQHPGFVEQAVKFSEQLVDQESHGGHLGWSDVGTAYAVDVSTRLRGNDKLHHGIRNRAREAPPTYSCVMLSVKFIRFESGLWR